MDRLAIVLSVAGLIGLTVAGATFSHRLAPGPSQGKGGRNERAVDPAVVAGPANRTAAVAAPTATGFTPQLRLAFEVGDQWEPAIAADRAGHVYVLYSQYAGVPGCASCASPTQILQVSADHGQTWAAPRPIDLAGAGGGQWDSQIVVDPVDGRTVYAAWLQNNKSDIVVARSDDFGASWRSVVADATNAGTDKPILAPRGSDVYVAYNHAQTVWVAASHDGGRSFAEVKINQNGKLGWSLGGGGAVTAAGSALFAWAGYEGSGGARGDVNLYVSRSTDGGQTWSTRPLDRSAAPPDCSAFACGWAYLGAQAVLASDGSAVYAAWNGGAVARGPERIWFARSSDDGVTFSPRREVSLAPAGSHHAFPALVAAAGGDVRIGWMDARVAAGGQDRWNVYYRRSGDGGASWGPEVDVATSVGGFAYLFGDGFRYPFGDYWEMDVDETGTAHLIFGEGWDYQAPGSIWYAQGR